MTTTVSVSPDGQLALPKEFRRRKRIRTGTSLRVVEIAGGLYVTPILEPTERDLRKVLAAAGSLDRPETSADEATTRQIIADYRHGARRKR